MNTFSSRICFIFYLLIGLCLTSTARSSVIDAPHNETNHIACGDCHKYSLWWHFSPVDSDPTVREEKTNSVCLTCHGESGPEITVITHASLVMGSSHRDSLDHWSRACTDCHDPHFQAQLDWLGEVPASELYLVTGELKAGSLSVSGEGTILSPYSSTFEYQNIHTKTDWEQSNSPWTAKTGSADRGLILALGGASATYEITGVDESNATITVNGAIDAGYDTGTSFGLIYGQLIRSEIAVGARVSSVKFFNPKGGFIDSSENSEGICQVCHTETFHFRNTGEVNTGEGLYDHTGETGSNCINCHSHTNAFAHGGGNGSSCGTAAACHGTRESHPTHVADSGVVRISCADCHNITSFPEFKDGKNLAHTHACDNCHSGTVEVSLAKQYWGAPGSSSNTAGSWAAVEGEISFCGSCHDGTPGNSQSDGAGDLAFNVMGDNSTYGFSITGHGKVNGNYPLMYYQAGSGTGNPAANLPCSACHDLTQNHFNNMAKRLKPGFGNDQANSNCNQCHYSGGLAANDPTLYTYSSDYEAASHGQLLCTDCHDLHGMATNADPAMAKDGKRDLCLGCHYNENPYGAPVPGDPPAAHAALATEGCTTCHNPHNPAHGEGATGAGCIECHGHDSGTKYDADMTIPYTEGTLASQGRGTFQSHSTHTETTGDDAKGPGIYCDSCHDIVNFPYFKSGTESTGDGKFNLSETDVCDTCHSTGGAFEGVNDAVIGAKKNWKYGVYTGSSLTEGKEQWCVGCHDTGTSIINGRQAPDVAGNNSSYGFYLSGHGAKATECGACHALDMDHNFDGQKTYDDAAANYKQGYRLSDVGGLDPMNIPKSNDTCGYTNSDYSLCFSCHDEQKLIQDTKSDGGVYECNTNPYGGAASITTGFRNEAIEGLNGGASDIPANIHWDHLVDIHSIFMGNFWDSDGDGTRDSKATCVTCHNPHGDSRVDNSTPTVKMTAGTLDIRLGTDAIGDFAENGPDTNFPCAVCHPGSARYYRTNPNPSLDSIAVVDNNLTDPSAAEPGYTNNHSVEITMTRSGIAAPTEMIFAEDPLFTNNSTDWIVYTSPYTYTLSIGDGSKNVYAKIRSTTGESAVKHDTIILDTAEPTISAVSLTSPNGAEVWLQETLHDITWEGIADSNLKTNPILLTYSTNSGESYPHSIIENKDNDGTYQWTLPPIESSTTKLLITATDKAGNQATDASDADFTIAPVTPLLSGLVLIDNKNSDPTAADPGYSNNPSIKVSISANNNPTQMMFSEDPGFTQNSTGWIAYNTSYIYTMTADNGLKNVYCKLKNGAGESATKSSTIILDTVNPTMLSSTLNAPNGGEFWETGSNQTVLWTSSDIYDSNLKTNPIRYAYSADGGITYTPLAGEHANSGNWSWDSLPALPSYKSLIRITAYDRAGNIAADVSDGNFSVRPPSNYIVTNTNNSGAGSLRQAITDIEAAGGNSAIWFNIPPGSLNKGVAIINVDPDSPPSPLNPLPQLTQPNITIDGGSQTALQGDTNGYGPEIRLTGPCVEFACLFDTSLAIDAINIGDTAVNSSIKGLQFTEVGSGIRSSGAGTVITGNHFGFSSDNTGTYVPKDNLRNIVLSGADAMVGGSDLAARNFVSCADGSGIYAAGSNTRIINNMVGLMPDGILCSNYNFNIGAAVEFNNSSNSLFQDNIVAGSYYGLLLNGTSSSNNVKGNTFGVYYDAGTWKSVGGSSYAIYINSGNAAGNIIGGATMATDDANLHDSNVFDPGSYGIYVHDATDYTTQIYGNFIGTNPEQDEVFSGLVGILVRYLKGVTIGGDNEGEAGNVIANMSSYGVQLYSSSARYVTIRKNSFYNNGNNTDDDAIFLNGGNNNYSRPTISSATTTTVAVTGVEIDDIVEIYIADFSGTEYGEGKTFIGSAVATGSLVNVPVSGVNTGQWVTAIRTSDRGFPYYESSPFSANVQVP